LHQRPTLWATPRGWFGVAVFVACLVALFMVYRAGDDAPQPSASGGTVSAKVDRVVDGDTAKVFYDGESEYVRYIGIDTPESVKPDTPVECFGEESKEFNAGLIEGETVRLVFGPEKRDRFGRLLAYVYVSDLMVNAELLRRGYAETLTIPPNDARSGQFERLEQEARRQSLGRWSACG
jgi:micrococcal nuclease